MDFEWTDKHDREMCSLDAGKGNPYVRIVSQLVHGFPTLVTIFTHQQVCFTFLGICSEFYIVHRELAERQPVSLAHSHPPLLPNPTASPRRFKQNVMPKVPTQLALFPGF